MKKTLIKSAKRREERAVRAVDVETKNEKHAGVRGRVAVFAWGLFFFFFEFSNTDSLKQKWSSARASRVHTRTMLPWLRRTCHLITMSCLPPRVTLS